MIDIVIIIIIIIIIGIIMCRIEPIIYVCSGMCLLFAFTRFCFS